MKTRIDTRLLVANILGASLAPVLRASLVLTLVASLAPVLGASLAPILGASLAPILVASLALGASLAPILVASLALGGSTSASDANVAGVESTLARPMTTGWICDRADSICGLDDPKMLSSPAKVDYDALYKSTAEYKKIRDEKIDANSSEGIQLRQRAVDRIREKTESIRSQKGHCSVWKTIRHTDARAIPDITDQIKALL